MASCGQMIEGNVVAFSCDLEAGHDGPHRAYENARSVRERKKWEETQTQQAHADSGLGQFQGRAETTAERYTENPTAVPGWKPVEEAASQVVRDDAGNRFAVVDGLLVRIEDEALEEDLPETPVVYTEDQSGSQFRTASSAEAKAAAMEAEDVDDLPEEPAFPAVDSIHLIDFLGVPDAEGVPQPMQMRVIGRIDGGVRVQHTSGPLTFDMSLSAFRSRKVEVLPGEVLEDHSLMDPDCRARPTGREGVLMHADANARCMVCRPLTALDQMAQNHEPTKQREGDQPLPIPTGEEYVQDRIIAKVETLVRNGKMDRGTADGVIAKMEESKRVGMQRYGTALQTFNGRDALQDAEEEARDLFVYLSSLMQAREASREKLVEVVAKDIGRALPTRLDWEDVSEERIAEIAVDAILRGTGGFQT